MLRHNSIFPILIIVSLASCNQYNRILEDVYDNDQAAREWTKGMSSLSADEIVNYSTEMELADSLNQAIVFGILDKEGWPSHLSDKANQAIWIVIDHSDLACRSKYLALVKEKAEQGILDKTSYAILNDRVLMEEESIRYMVPRLRWLQQSWMIKSQCSYVYGRWKILKILIV